MSTIKIVIERAKSSYDFRADPARPDGFDNNYKNNSKDWLVLCDGGTELARFRCQSVANYCFGANATADTVAHGDTVAPGEFELRLFVEPRNFHGEIHAITRTRDLDGQWIGRDAMQTTAGGYQNGRWLVHDRWSAAQGGDTAYAWSAGCFILSSDDLAALNTLLHAYKFSPGDIVSGEVVEIDL
ncbi:MAG: hypothetical protein K2H09_08760 [Treponemataceae bacterium]|nr:hypothetical protein [Treponemataceae bacterium]